MLVRQGQMTNMQGSRKLALSSLHSFEFTVRELYCLSGESKISNFPVLSENSSRQGNVLPQQGTAEGLTEFVVV